MMILIRRFRPVLLALLVAGCMPCPYPAASPAAAPPDARMTPLDSVRVVEVVIRTEREGAGGSFAPKVARVRRGDLLRFRMADGDAPHNVSFTAFVENPAGVRLPPDGPFLTEPGQSWQLRVDLPPGRYTFVCIPHFPFGQQGTLIVEP